MWMAHDDTAQLARYLYQHRNQKFGNLELSRDVTLHSLVLLTNFTVPSITDQANMPRTFRLPGLAGLMESP